MRSIPPFRLPHVMCLAGVLRAVFQTLVIAGLLVASSSPAHAQSRDRDKDRSEGATGPQLQNRLSKAEESLLKEYMEVANEYYKQGDKESSVAVLQKISSLNPKMDGLKQRIEGIQEELLQANGLKSSVDVSKSWVPVCEVEEGKPFRLAATGDYRMEYATTVPLTGLSTSDPAQDHLAVAPFGALIGVVVTDGKPGEPFAVNAGLEHTPKKSGQLYLRVNVPAAAKCKGELKLQISGAVKPLTKKR
jgi:hypothetical protein